MTSRRWNLLATLVTLGLGVALFFAPLPDDPQPGDQSDMGFYGLMAALLGTATFGLSAWAQLPSDSAWTQLVRALGIICVAVLVTAHLALWTA